TQDERQLLLGADKGEGLLLIRGNRVALRVVASSAEYRLATTNPRDLDQLVHGAAAARQASAGPPTSTVVTSIGAVMAARRTVQPGSPDTNGTGHASAS